MFDSDPDTDELEARQIAIDQRRLSRARTRELKTTTRMIRGNQAPRSRAKFYCHRPDCNRVRCRNFDFCTKHRPITQSDMAGDDCAICQEAMKVNKKCIKLSCDHVYHKNCIREWMRRNPTCPTCRAPIDANMFSRRAAGNQYEPRTNLLRIFQNIDLNHQAVLLFQIQMPPAVPRVPVHVLNNMSAANNILPVPVPAALPAPVAAPPPAPAAHNMVDLRGDDDDHMVAMPYSMMMNMANAALQPDSSNFAQVHQWVNNVIDLTGN
jgi:hypothetical protein